MASISAKARIDPVLGIHRPMARMPGVSMSNPPRGSSKSFRPVVVLAATLVVLADLAHQLALLAQQRVGDGRLADAR